MSKSSEKKAIASLDGADVRYGTEAQILCDWVDTTNFVFIGGRGVAKSTVIIARRLWRCVLDMPGAPVAIVANSYSNLVNNIMPAVQKGWKLIGMIEGIHYIKGRRPPEEWRSKCSVTVDEQMGRRIQGIKPGESPVLFYFPPTAEGSGTNADVWKERNLCVVFVMAMYDPQRTTSYDVLASTQPVIEAVKRSMLDDIAAGCPVMDIDVSTLNTLPETEFYRNFAGWSIGFTAY